MHTTPSGKQSLAGAADGADKTPFVASRGANREGERARAYGQHALERAEGTLEEWRDNVDPVVNKLATKAQELARQSLDMASEASHKAQQSLSRYADVTTRYVAQQPMRSVLIAAAVGAAVALLVAATRQRR